MLTTTLGPVSSALAPTEQRPAERRNGILDRSLFIFSFLSVGSVRARPTELIGAGRSGEERRGSGNASARGHSRQRRQSGPSASCQTGTNRIPRPAARRVERLHRRERRMRGYPFRALHAFLRRRSGERVRHCRAPENGGDGRGPAAGCRPDRRTIPIARTLRGATDPSVVRLEFLLADVDREVADLADFADFVSDRCGERRQ